ncbi:c-type cytochrome [Achromobacter xylosoxidans]|uniref:c-type cytochrome n=1 Tax=Alcaligenes xylosoxydans xylosoxydans TaxID=85698 RepID=UPI001C52924A|nr:cytochrome c [Achromobacter xylosoxidans]
MRPGRGLTCLALACCMGLGAAAARAQAAPDIGPVDQQRLIHLVRQDCGSCHGLRLNGGLGPALTPQALAGKPPAYLEQAILRGLPGTAMPGWRGMLAPDEAAWIAARLLQGFPEE